MPVLNQASQRASGSLPGMLSCRLLQTFALATAVSLISPPALAASTSCLPASLKAALRDVASKFGPVSVISTHRPGATIKGSGRPSYHRWCRAVDFVPPRGKYGAVVAYLQRSFSAGYVLSYGSGHIHIDDAKRGRPR